MSIVKYTKNHEWLAFDGDVVTIGVTRYAQEQLGDVVFVELPERGRELAAGEEAATIESVKAAGEIVCPVSGTVVAVNPALEDDPALVNRDPEGEGWLFKMKSADPSDAERFMDQAAYGRFLDEQV